jgi:hypothetical protein
MNGRASNALPKIALTLVPFILLLGVWVWKQAGEAGGTQSATRPHASTSSQPISGTATTTPPPPLLTTVESDRARKAAEKVLKVYLSNPGPNTPSDLESLRPLVRSALFMRIANEWKGANTRAEPRVSEIRSVTLVPLKDDMGVRYAAEVLQIVTFPAGDDEFNTLSVSIRIKQVQGEWIVHDLTVT